MSSSFGLNAGTFDHILTYSSGDTLVAKIEYALEDSSILYRKYNYIRNVVYEGSDSLATQTCTTHSSLNGLPSFIREEVSPFEPRALSVDTDPDQQHHFHRTTEITYAASLPSHFFIYS